ncbi:MAG TPA: DUF2911 domain-containing protein [Bacteroidota bacterium]
MTQRATAVRLPAILIIAVVLCATVQELQAQLKLPRISPNANVTQTIGTTVVKVDYSRPGVKGREIWGKLVPYDQVWRAGANDATTISFSSDVTVNGKKLPAGSYTFFILPTAGEWTFIFNSEPKQWGAFNYNKEKDVLRIAVKPEAAPGQEWLSYNFENIKSNSCRFVMRWEKIVAGVTIETAPPPKDARISPAATVGQSIGVTDIVVNYSRPGVKGREIWGKLVPYNEVWRAGANEATTVSFSDDVLVNGHKLAAGTYGFFLLPTEKEWTFIFNSEAKQWGAFNYHKDNDVLRVSVTPETTPQQEWLEYKIDPVKSNIGSLSLNWDTMRGSVSIEVDTTPAFLWDKVKAQVSAKLDDATMLNQGARYALNSKQHLDEAMTWAQKSVSVKKMYSNLRTLAELYAQSGNVDNAVKTGEEAIKIGKDQDPKLDTAAFEKMIADWKSRK